MELKLICKDIKELEMFYGFYLESSLLSDSFGKWCRAKGYIKTLRDVAICDMFQQTDNAHRICTAHAWD